MQRMLLVLKRSPEQEATLEQLLEQQQDNSSPKYHHWLTPEQFGLEFGPSDQDIQVITTWLQSHGFELTEVSTGRIVIHFSGTAAQVQEAFHTAIHKYAVNGEQHYANASDPQIPAALAPVVAGIRSLHNFRAKPMYRLRDALNKPKTGTARGLAAPEYSFSCVDFLTSVFGAFSGQSTSCHDVGPYDFATIYNVLPLWNANPPIDGTGQTIAIVARTNINIQDVADFRSLFGLPANPPQVVIEGPDPGLVSGDETEADLDVEWSGAVAKGATIKLVVSGSTETTDGIDLSALYIVDHNIASVMSTSYGQCELRLGAAGNQFHYNLWEQAAAQGVTAFVSTGDNGAASCDSDQGYGPLPAQYGLQVNGLASTPHNVAVGGTDFNDYFNQATYWSATNAAGTLVSVQGYIPETTWNASCTNALLENSVFHLSPDPETNCNNDAATTWFTIPVGASGGMSNCTSPSGTTASSCAGGYAKPVWQVEAGVPDDGKRDLPDVSLFASSGFQGSSYIMCESDLVQGAPCSTSAFVGVGGTSASTPAFAGLLALVNQKTGSRQGNVNYVFYGLAAKQSAMNCNSSTGPASTCVFNDVTSGTIAMPCATGSLNCTTTNPSDQFGILSGYQAGTGYDLASGLGSVNATNLVNGWNSVSAGKASTTSLTLNGGNAVNITHGTPVSVAISVSPASPEPSGLASLVGIVGGGSFGINALTVSNGTASGTTNMLPGGASYSVQAHYAGDLNYAPSDSNPITVTVNPEPSETIAHAVILDWNTGAVTNPNASSVPYGSISVLRADVTNSSGVACVNSGTGLTAAGCPTGTLTLADNGTAVTSGPMTLNSEGFAESGIVSLPAGLHTLTGSYSGDNSYSPSTFSSSFTVTPAPTLTGGPETMYPYPIGAPTVLDLEVRSVNPGNFVVTPGGTFTMAEDGNPLPVTVINTYSGSIYPYPDAPYVYETLDGNVRLTVQGPSGAHTLTVNYSGDPNYSPCTSGPVTIDAVYLTQTLLSSSAPTVVAGQPVTLTAQIMPSQNASVGPTGTVTFAMNGSAIATIPVTNAQAQYTFPSLGVGNYQLIATYSGDTNYNTSTATMTETVTQVSTSLSITSTDPTVMAGQFTNITARITPAQNGVAAPTGWVLFTANGTTIQNSAVTNSQATIITSFATLGAVQVQAAYSGDMNFLPSTATFTETVVSSPPDFSLSASGPATQTVSAGQTATFANVISVSAINQFASQVNLTCSSAAYATTCTVNPSVLTSGTGTASVVVTTAARSVTVPLTPSLRVSARTRYIPSLPLILSVAAFVFAFAQTNRRRGLRVVTAVVMTSWILWQAAGCGGGPGSGPPQYGTPSGTYSITVTGTSGNRTHSTTLTLVVN